MIYLQVSSKLSYRDSEQQSRCWATGVPTFCFVPTQYLLALPTTLTLLFNRVASRDVNLVEFVEQGSDFVFYVIDIAEIYFVCHSLLCRHLLLSTIN